MKFFPALTFSVITVKDKEAVLEILRNNNFESRIRLSKDNDQEHGKAFCGEIADDRFKLKQCLVGYNLFIPVILGKLKEEYGICTIEISLRLFKMAKEIIKNVIVYSAFFVLMAITLSLTVFTFSYIYLLLFLVPAAVYVMMIFGFVYFTKKLQQRFIKLFGASTKITGYKPV